MIKETNSFNFNRELLFHLENRLSAVPLISMFLHIILKFMSQHNYIKIPLLLELYFNTVILCMVEDVMDVVCWLVEVSCK